MAHVPLPGRVAMAGLHHAPSIQCDAIIDFYDSQFEINFFMFSDFVFIIKMIFFVPNNFLVFQKKKTKQKKRRSDELIVIYGYVQWLPDIGGVRLFRHPSLPSPARGCMIN